MSAALRLLLVDDERDNSDALRLFLEFQGCRVRVASEGDGALDALREDTVDAVVCDLVLAPPWSGEMLASRIRAGFDPAIVLVAFSGRGTPAVVDAALAAGFDRHVLKPCAPGRLLELVRELVSARRA